MEDTNRALFPDSSRYIELADSLVSHQRFALSKENGAVHLPLSQIMREAGEYPTVDGLTSEIFRTPGYPVFLAIARDLRIALFIQCLLSAVTVVLVYRLGLSLNLSESASAIGAIILALHPADIVSANVILTESLFSFLVVVSLLSNLNNRSCYSGLLLASATLVRPVSLFLGILMPLLQRGSLRSKLSFFAIFLIPLLLWCSRNYTEGRGFRISSVPAINSFYYTGAYIQIAKNGGDSYSDWPNAVATLHQELKDKLVPGEDIIGTISKLGIEKVCAEPSLYLMIVTKSALKFTLDHSLPTMFAVIGKEYFPSGFFDSVLKGESPSLSASALIPILWMGWNLLLAVGSVVGVCSLYRSGNRSSAVLLGLIFLGFLISTQTVGLERFRVPVIWVQSLLSGAAIASSWRRCETLL